MKTPPRDGLIRAFPSLDFRGVTDKENDVIEGAPDPLKEEGDQQEPKRPRMYGHFLVFNANTEINSYFEGNFMERISPGAAAKTIGENRAAMRSLFQHGMDPQIGDKPLGPIDVLREDGNGVYYEVPLLDTSYTRDLIPGLEDGLYGASFAFTVLREEFDEEPGESVDNPKGLPMRTLKEIRVHEFGPVTFPAYQGASAGVRSMTDDYLAAIVAADHSQADALMERAADPERLAEVFARAARTSPSVFFTRSADAEVDGEGDDNPEPDRAEAQGDEPAADAPAKAEGEGGENDEADGESDDERSADNSASLPADGSGDSEQHSAPPERAGRKDRRSSGRRDRSSHKPAPAEGDKDTRSEPMNLAELRSRNTEIEDRLTAIDADAGDAELSAEAQTEYDTLSAELERNEKSIESIEKRNARIRTIAERRPEQVEDGDGDEDEDGDERRGAHFHVPRERDKVYDYGATLARSRSAGSVVESRAIMRDAALRAIDGERSSSFYTGDTSATEAGKEFMEALLRREAMVDEFGHSEIAERIIGTGSQEYLRSFAKQIARAPLTPDEQRALASFTAASGGYAVPYTLDPTLIPTSNYSINPFRAISRVETLVASNEWKGVTTGAVTASYAAEGAEASDNSPTLAQPTAIPERAQAFIPFSLELEGDWPAALAEMGKLISEGKDDLEASKFVNGAGHGSKEPEGIITGGTEVVPTATAKTFVIADLYKLEESLPPRFRAEAQFVGQRWVFNKIRQFDTAGGAGLWVYLRQGVGGHEVPTPGRLNAELLGYPVNAASNYQGGLTTAEKVLTIGNFQYFLIVDRVGMNVDLIPHLFGASQRPTGQRGLYAFWRNTSKVLSAKAFRTLEIG